MVSLTVNGEKREFDVEDDMPLLWALRDVANLTGTKFGCGAGLCGACSVLVDGEITRSCVTPVESVAGADIRTIEALATADKLSAVQQAWAEIEVPQCGYCQPGMIMAVTALLAETPQPSDQDIDAAITNICRCGTYDRIRKGIHRAAEIVAAS